MFAAAEDHRRGRMPVAASVRERLDRTPRRGSVMTPERQHPPASLSEADLAAARSIADEVGAASSSGQPLVLFSVVDVMSRFGIKRLSHQARSRITDAFHALGLSTDSVLSGVDETRTIQVSSALTDAEASSGRWIDARVFRVGAEGGEVLDVGALADLVVAEGEVLWINIQPGADDDEVLGLLRRHLSPDVTSEMVDDLLEYDVEPKVQEYGERLRSVSFVGVEARESHRAGETGPGAESMAGELCFQLVESLVGERTIVTCWHHGRVCRGLDSDTDTPSILRDKAERAIDRAWAAGPLTPGDLGTHLLGTLVDTYRHAHRRLESWLQLWELDLHKNSLKTETRTLNDLFALVNEFRRRLAAMNYAHSLAEGHTWFPVSDSHLDGRIDAMVDRTLRKLAILFENIRADMELVTMQHVVDQAISASRQAEQAATSTQIAQEQRIANEQFQDRLAKVTALLLVPTLIAGIYGANTQIPGGGKWSGFAAMILLMVVASTAVYIFMLRANRAQQLHRRAMALFRRPTDDPHP